MMKAFLFYFLLACNTLYGQCPLDGVFQANKQSELDSFSILFPDCKYIEDLILKGFNIQNVDNLLTLDSIGSIELKNTGISNILLPEVSVLNSLNLIENKLLSEVDLNITSTSAVIQIINNTLLHSIDLGSISTIETIQIISDSLTISINCNKIKWSQIVGNIKFNAVLPIKVTSQFEMASNSFYKSFNQLSTDFNLSKVRFIAIAHIDSFNSSGFINSTELQSLSFLKIDFLDTNDFRGEPMLLNEFYLRSITNLTTLEDFAEVEARFDLKIENNSSLESLVGLEKSIASSKKINIVGNENLQNADALSFMRDTLVIDDRFILKDNTALSYCNYDPLCNLISNSADNPNLVIEGNDIECETIEAIAESCLVYSNDLDNVDILLWPNPVVNELNFSVPVSVTGIYSLTGNSQDYHTTVTPQTSISLENIPSGIYVIRITYEGKHIVKKLVIN